MLEKLYKVLRLIWSNMEVNIAQVRSITPMQNRRYSLIVRKLPGRFLTTPLGHLKLQYQGAFRSLADLSDFFLQGVGFLETLPSTNYTVGHVLVCIVDNILDIFV